MNKGITTGLLAIAMLFGVANVNAQKKVTFGIKAGANVSNISGHGHNNTTMPTYGYNAGLTVDFAVTRNFYILSGGEFTVKGYETKGSPRFPGTKVEAMYVQVPLHAGYAFHVTDNTKVIFHAGPYAAYGVGGDTEVEGTPVKFDTFSDTGLKEWDFGVGGGVDIDYKHFTIGLAYDHGLIDVAQNDVASIYNSNAQLKVGIKF